MSDAPLELPMQQIWTNNSALFGGIITLIVTSVLSVIFRNLPSTSWIAAFIRAVVQSGWNYFNINGLLVHRSEVADKLSKIACVTVALFALLLTQACGAVSANIATATATLSTGQTIQFQYCVVIMDTAILANGAEMNCFTDSAQATLFANAIANVTDGSVTIIKQAKPRAVTK
jgi:hypothetical protein